MSPESAAAAGPWPDPTRSVLGVALALFGATAVAHALFAWDPTPWLALLPSCPIRGVTGVPCPGCGMTRALVLLAQLRLPEALAMHPAAPLVLAGSVALAVRRAPVPPPLRRALASAGVAVLLAIWAGRGLELLPPLGVATAGTETTAGPLARAASRR